MRKTLLDLSQNIKIYRERSGETQSLGEGDLAQKGFTPELRLMHQGRHLWEELNVLGTKFKQINSEIGKGFKQIPEKKLNFEESWTKLEIDLEIDLIRKAEGPSNNR